MVATPFARRPSVVVLRQRSRHAADRFLIITGVRLATTALFILFRPALEGTNRLLLAKTQCSFCGLRFPSHHPATYFILCFLYVVLLTKTSPYIVNIFSLHWPNCICSNSRILILSLCRAFTSRHSPLYAIIIESEDLSSFRSKKKKKNFLLCTLHYIIRTS